MFKYLSFFFGFPLSKDLNPCHSQCFLRRLQWYVSYEDITRDEAPGLLFHHSFLDKLSLNKIL